MRRRLIIGSIALIYLISSLVVPSQETHALMAWLEKAKSDCKSVEAAVTLTYSQDDTGASDRSDHFKLVIFDGAKGTWLAEIKESILQEQSPFYWQTGRIEATSSNGLYRIEVWDTDDQGGKQRIIEQVYLQCQTQNTWRADPVPVTPRADGFAITCYSRTPFYSTNGAPEKGAVLVMWTFGKERTDQEYHLQTIPVERGTTFDMFEVRTPCSTYLRLYFQPDSTKLLYYMPSQYWPHDLYGTADQDFEVGPIYHTFFPLDGPVRGATATPVPTVAPTATP